MLVEDAELFVSGFERVDYAKNDFLLEKGDTSNVVKIILKGCARGFYIKDGKEFTTNFYFENDHSYDYANYLQNKPSQITIKALSPIKTIEMTMEALEFLNSEIIGFHRMTFQLFKTNFIKVEEQRQSLIIKTPKERYLDLLKNNKQIISRVPQHQIVSFIGVSAEHLSRIRKEIRDAI
ncbi:Crp/Fnr family transcriptional regulator [Aequorivita marina]|uniref:Crp/Fnr family transcriptional regulator n=1 Tax=Aequorivita marina TaxID=3073654 RepID=UPI00287507DD|nr:Crp/Fnr family transcriptional regulator [Aequorivita sp. S2608]MDS1299394.1 Crp/Fnr family transcriptional regulator [Aequorivita sp. S2608]